jgi:hypothetical protein
MVCLTQALQYNTMRPPIGKSYIVCDRPAAWYASRAVQAGAHQGQSLGTAESRTAFPWRGSAAEEGHGRPEALCWRGMAGSMGKPKQYWGIAQKKKWNTNRHQVHNRKAIVLDAVDLMTAGARRCLAMAKK